MRNRGFTLIELLVTIFIISILAGMLLVGLSKAKGHANKIVCVNNLKQIGVACYAYEGDNNRMVDFLSWLYPKNTIIGGDLTKGKLFNYLGNKKSYLCPTEENKSTIINEKMLDLFDYNLESLKIDHSYTINCYSCHIKNIAQSLSPSKTVYFLERTNLLSNNGDSLIAKAQKSYLLNFLHGNRTILLKMDSHVEIINEKQFYQETTNNAFWHPTTKNSYW